MDNNNFCNHYSLNLNNLIFAQYKLILQKIPEAVIDIKYLENEVIFVINNLKDKDLVNLEFFTVDKKSKDNFYFKSIDFIIGNKSIKNAFGIQNILKNRFMYANSIAYSLTNKTYSPFMMSNMDTKSFITLIENVREFIYDKKENDKKENDRRSDINYSVSIATTTDSCAQEGSSCTTSRDCCSSYCDPVYGCQGP